MARVPASELHRITAEDLKEGVEAVLKGAPHEFAESTRFDLLVDSEKRVPPKAVVGLAARRVFGKTLGPYDFSGGESSAAFRLLWDRGFEIVTKRLGIGLLDATFSVGNGPEGVFLLVESSGPERNLEYNAGLETLLHGLADLNATLEQVEVDSRATRHLPRADRLIAPDGLHFPLELGTYQDIAELRLKLTGAAAKTARSRSAAAGGGNPRKRLRLTVSVPGEGTLHDLALTVAQERAAPPASAVSFSFSASGPPATGGESERASVASTRVSFRHAEMQRQLYAQLVDEYGESRISCEQPMASRRPADIVVDGPSGVLVFELKTAPSPRECIRQSLGQLLEYSSWPGSPPLAAMIIVGPTDLDARSSEYLEILRKRFSLPLSYRCQPFR